jgi:hypothetical protein
MLCVGVCACCYVCHICSYMYCYSSSCPSSPPFSVHHFARSPSDTHISGGGFVAYTKSSPFEVRNELFSLIMFRDFPCLLHKLTNQISSTTVINLTFIWKLPGLKPTAWPICPEWFYLGYPLSSQYLKIVKGHIYIHSDLSFTILLYFTAVVF